MITVFPTKRSDFTMRLPNGYGSIRKLSGKRRRPFQVLVTTGWDYKDGKAKQIQKPIGYFETRPEAMIALAEYNKSPYDIDAKTTTFDDIYIKAIKPNVDQMKFNSAKSWKAAYGHTKPLHNMRMVDIKKAHLQAIIDSKADGSKGVQNNIKKLFRAVFKYALENDIITKDYSQFIDITAKDENKKVKIPFTKEEIALLWENIDYTDTKKYTKVQTVDSMIILIYTGLRINEMLALKVEDINLEERIITVNGTKTDAAERITPIHKDIIPLIEKRIAQGNEYLITHDGKPITDAAYRLSIFSRICDHFGMVHKPHDCRKTFVTFAKKCKLDDLRIKKMVGHASHDITEDVYTHVFKEDLVKDIDKLNFSE